MKAQLLLVAFALSPNDAVPERRRTTDLAAYDVVIAALQLTWGSIAIVAPEAPDSPPRAGTARQTAKYPNGFPRH